MNTKLLAKRIRDFLEKYAGKDEDGEYTSPDAYQLHAVATRIEQGMPIVRCWSEWGSGGYKPYTSTEGRQEHDLICAEVEKLI